MDVSGISAWATRIFTPELNLEALPLPASIEGNLDHFMIKDIRHSWIQHAVRLIRERKYRAKCGTMIITGHKIISECQLPFKTIATTENCQAALTFPQASEQAQRLLLSEDAMKFITGEAKPEGIVAEISCPTIHTSLPLHTRKILAAIDLRDAGNLGALIRTATAMSWDAVMLIGSIVDLLHPATVRSSMGACLKLPSIVVSDLEQLEYLAVTTWNIVIADISENVPATHRLQLQRGCVNFYSIDNLDLERNVLLLVGSESHGLGQVPHSILKKAIYASIATSADMPSLNASIAGAIVMSCLS